MARPPENKPWHPDALRLRAAGVSCAKIADALGLKTSTVQMFLTRNKDNEARQAEILLADKRPSKIAPLAATPKQSKSFWEILLLAERARTRSTVKAHRWAYEAMTRELTDEEKFQARYALEYLKVAKPIEVGRPAEEKATVQGSSEEVVFRIVDPDHKAPNA